MRNFKIIIGLFLVTFISCGKYINPDEVLNREKYFKLIIHEGNKYSSDDSIVTIINKDSEKIVNLKNWISNNSNGWKSSKASWATPDISLIGTDFRLLIFNDGVVIGFKDKNGNAREYTKLTNEKEFDFLID